MDEQAIIAQTEAHVRTTLSDDGTGHDWWHVQRVRRNALRIAEQEDVDRFVVELAALLHDIADWKFHGGDEEAGPRAARAWLERLELPEPTIAHICAIVAGVSFKGAGVPTPMASREGMVVQDADRLDALGAIGIARAFAYGGSRGRTLHDPDAPPRPHASFAQYRSNTGPTINHFYEKLLLLQERMHTPTARHIAAARHAFMEQFLQQFLAEWEGRA